jgi:hypothetical protein
VEAKTAAASTAIDTFRNATRDAVTKANDYSAKMDAAIPVFGGPSATEIDSTVRPAADAYAGSVDTMQNAFAQLGTAVAQLEESLR